MLRINFTQEQLNAIAASTVEMLNENDLFDLCMVESMQNTQIGSGVLDGIDVEVYMLHEPMNRIVVVDANAHRIIARQ